MNSQGLWQKLMLFQAEFMNGEHWLVAVILVGSFLTIGGVGRAGIQMIWRGGDIDTPDGQYEPRGRRLEKHQLNIMMLPIVIIFLLTFLLGIFPEFLIQFANLAAGDLFNTDLYVKNTLGGL